MAAESVPRWSVFVVTVSHRVTLLTCPPDTVMVSPAVTAGLNNSMVLVTGAMPVAVMCKHSSSV